ncbi:MAG: short-chain dehydrogenase, partial [Pseudomonadota bacterium]
GEDGFAKLRETVGANDGLLDPEHVAETYWHLARQHRSVWTHELDLRAWSDQAWWNHAPRAEI